jgi:hypothetical protein
VSTKTRPAGDAVNVPALDPAGNTGNGSVPPWQKGPLYANCALLTNAMVKVVLTTTGQGGLLVNDMVYVPGKLALTLMAPVVVLEKTSPAGDALNVPPAGLFITGVTVPDAAQTVLDGYWNWGLAPVINVTITGVRLLEHVAVLACA